MELVKFPNGSLDDIPSLMEAVAWEIREGIRGNIKMAAAVFVKDDGDIFICGWGGDADSIRGIGILQLGAAWLANRHVIR